MTFSRKLWLAVVLFVFIISACTNSVTPNLATSMPLPDPTEKPAERSTPLPAVSSLQVDKEALRGVQVNVWHPWFGAQAGLFESQIATFNTENEWGIVVHAEGKSNFAELFAQTTAALEENTNPNIVIALPEHAFGWGDHVVDLNVYVNDPLYGFSAADILDFPPAIWDEDNVDGKRFGVPAQRTARFLLYNRTWAQELGFLSPPATSVEFEQQACAANKALAADSDPNNNALGGWLIDTNPMTPLSWILAFGGSAQEEQSYRFLTPANINAFRFVKVLQQKNCAWVSSPDLSVYDRFAMRQALFATASLEELPDQSRAFFTSGSQDEWTVIPFPGDEGRAFVIYGSSFVMFPSDDVTQLASWLFMRWMLSPERQADWVKSTGLFPLRTSTVSLLADYTTDHLQWAEAVKLLPEGKLPPQLGSWHVVRIMLGDAFGDMFDTIRHPDLTDGQVPLILKQMDETVTDLSN
ncbi:MAG TPA: extracellular solute-binding protein [Anaerolineales bacterium]|nr:extracellular solute-binding protein [Anaerolineales bacterium]